MSFCGISISLGFLHINFQKIIQFPNHFIGLPLVNLVDPQISPFITIPSVIFIRRWTCLSLLCCLWFRPRFYVDSYKRSHLAMYLFFLILIHLFNFFQCFFRDVLVVNHNFFAILGGGDAVWFIGAPGARFLISFGHARPIDDRSFSQSVFLRPFLGFLLVLYFRFRARLDRICPQNGTSSFNCHCYTADRFCEVTVQSADILTFIY